MQRGYDYIFSLQDELDLIELIYFLEEELTALGIDDENKVYMNLVLEEACTNALKHSSDKDNILVAFFFSQEKLKIHVYQKGEPFALTQSGLCQHVTHGRGLTIICGLMDEVNLIKQGEQILLEMVKEFKEVKREESACVG